MKAPDSFRTWAKVAAIAVPSMLAGGGGALYSEEIKGMVKAGYDAIVPPAPKAERFQIAATFHEKDKPANVTGTLYITGPNDSERRIEYGVLHSVAKEESPSVIDSLSEFDKKFQDLFDQSGVPKSYRTEFKGNNLDNYRQEARRELQRTMQLAGGIIGIVTTIKGSLSDFMIDTGISMPINTNFITPTFLSVCAPRAESCPTISVYLDEKTGELVTKNTQPVSGLK